MALKLSEALSEKARSRYSQVLIERGQFRETNDCAVKALALATGESYEMAHYALECVGRLPRRGTSMQRIRAAAESLGYTWETVDHDNYSARTPVTLEREWQKRGIRGGFIVEFVGHVAAIVDGEVLDWTQGRRHRIWDIHKVTRAT